MPERTSSGLSVIEAIEREARRRYVRFDAAFWREVIEGPLVELTESLAGEPAAQSRRLAEAYLRLCAAGIGQGYFFSSQAGARNFFSMAFGSLLPRRLAEVSREKRPEVLAQCFNLAENLERSPGWLRQIFLRLCSRLSSLEGLEALVSDVARRVFEPPARKLGETFTAKWLHLAEDDLRFLPGRIEFVAPTVLRIFDRHQDGRNGGAPVTLGVWLADEPVALGPMGAQQPPGPPEEEDEKLWQALARSDGRFSPAFDAVRNAWHGAATLQTSQMLVVLYP